MEPIVLFGISAGVLVVLVIICLTLSTVIKRKQSNGLPTRTSGFNGGRAAGTNDGGMHMITMGAAGGAFGGSVVGGGGASACGGGGWGGGGGGSACGGGGGGGGCGGGGGGGC